MTGNSTGRHDGFVQGNPEAIPLSVWSGAFPCDGPECLPNGTTPPSCRVRHIPLSVIGAILRCVVPQGGHPVLLLLLGQHMAIVCFLMVKLGYPLGHVALLLEQLREMRETWMRRGGGQANRC